MRLSMFSQHSTNVRTVVPITCYAIKPPFGENVLRISIRTVRLWGFLLLRFLSSNIHWWKYWKNLLLQLRIFSAVSLLRILQFIDIRIIGIRSHFYNADESKTHIYHVFMSRIILSFGRVKHFRLMTILLWRLFHRMQCTRTAYSLNNESISINILCHWSSFCVIFSTFNPHRERLFSRRL